MFSSQKKTDLCFMNMSMLMISEKKKETEGRNLVRNRTRENADDDCLGNAC